jgi:hypothetical protein
MRIRPQPDGVVALALALATVASLASPAPARAQGEDDVGSEGESTQSRIARLAEEFSDPLTTLPQLFVQDAYTPASFGTFGQTNRIIARIIIPRVPRFSLLPLAQLIRPSFSIVTAPTGRGGTTRTGLGDFQLFDLFVLPWSSKQTGATWASGRSSCSPPRPTARSASARGRRDRRSRRSIL